MSKLSERQLLVVTVGVSVLLAGGLLALVFNDRSEIDEIETEIVTIEDHIRAADVEIRKTQSREEHVIVFRAVEDRELAVLPTKQRIADFHRNLSTFFQSAGLSFREAPESAPQESELAKGIFVTRSKLTCQGDSASILKFMNMVENDPRLIAVKGFELKAGRRDRDNPNLMPVHDVEIMLATYFYNPAAGGIERVHIPGEEQRLQEEHVKAAIADFQPERPDSYVLRPAAGRRDPLVDPRKQRQQQDEEELARQYEAEETVVVELENLHLDIAEKVEQEKALLADNRLFPADRLGRDIDLKVNDLRARLQHVVQMKSVIIPELQARLMQVQSHVELLMGRRPSRDLTVTASVAEDTYKTMLEHFEDGEYNELGTVGSAWQSFLRGKPVDPGARPAIDKIAGLRRRAKTHAEFNALSYHVDGQIIDKREPARSVALVNGSPVRTGDKLDERGDVVVGAITRRYVIFHYRDEQIRVNAGWVPEKPKSDEKKTGKAGSAASVRAVEAPSAR